MRLYFQRNKQSHELFAGIPICMSWFRLVWNLCVSVSYCAQHSTLCTVGQSHLLHWRNVASDVILIFRCLDPCFTHDMVIPTPVHEIGNQFISKHVTKKWTLCNRIALVWTVCARRRSWNHLSWHFKATSRYFHQRIEESRILRKTRWQPVCAK